MTWTDTHAHIYSKEFAIDREAALSRAAEAGLGKIFMPNIDVDSIDDMLEVESRNPGRCIPMMGLHPCSVKADFEKQLYTLEDWLQKRFFAAIGEMGTDLYWDKTFWEQQQEAFRIQVGWARKYKRPIVIHCRESMEETFDLLAPLAGSGLSGIFHCFTGTVEQAKKVADLGFYMGLGGVATFKNGGMDKVIPHLPIDRIVLETDSPYLAPVPYRGKRNEPAYLSLIATRVADLLNISADDLMTATTRNAALIFGDPDHSQNS